MVEIPTELRCLFSARLDEGGDGYVVEIPRREIREGTLDPGETYRVAVLARQTAEADGTDDDAASTDDGGDSSTRPRGNGAGGGGDGGGRGRTGSRDNHPDPPVSEGEVRTVTVEARGDQGDGIAKVERGYVVIVPGAEPGEEVEVEIASVQRNVAFAELQSASR